MQAFTTHTGVGVPLRRSNVDTDQIIPAHYLKRVSRTGFDEGLFARWREDETFVLNHPSYAGGSVLVSGPDFGTGSSREHAVWALMQYGFRVVISSRFADIFRGNSGKAGLLTAQVSQDDAELIMKYLENDPGATVSVDLTRRTVVAGDIQASFAVDDYTRWRLLNGLDDISLTLRHEEAISAFEARRPAHRPVTTTPVGGPGQTERHPGV
ncbi:MAG: 3-isopropylmalate dehydratase small subunit [Actinomycetota bacterium]|nr:3-isopropylmalate dehydratase small subunit [Actinomycetota bacterium]